MLNMKKYLAELLGTFVLTLVGCGVAVVTGVNVVATSLAFGLVVVAMAYSIGNISGCHLNPAISLAMLIRKQLNLKDFLFYVLAQFVGAILASLTLGLLLRANFVALGGNEIQGLLMNDPSGILNQPFLDAGSYLSAFAVEVILTFIFVFTIIGVTDKNHHDGKLAGLVIGLTLAIVHLLGLAFTGTSVNPARSFGPALIQAVLGNNTTSLSQVWIWLLAPLAGGALAAVTYTCLTCKKK